MKTVRLMRIMYDNVGLSIPKTLGEYYNVLKAFRYNDPDKNGKDDTYGFFVAEPIGTNSFGYIARAFAVCGGWGGDWSLLPDGTISQFGVTPAAKEAFKFIKKCYDEDLFNKSFVNEKDAEGKIEDLIAQNKLGISDISQPSGSFLVTHFISSILGLVLICEHQQKFIFKC